MKQNNVPTEKLGTLGYGDVWVWSCIDRDYKLIVRAMLGHRDAPTARVFIQDVSARMANRVQLSSDALAAYHQAVRDAFPLGVDYAIIKKTLRNATRAGTPLHASTVRGVQKDCCIWPANPSGRFNLAYRAKPFDAPADSEALGKADNGLLPKAREYAGGYGPAHGGL